MFSSANTNDSGFIQSDEEKIQEHMISLYATQTQVTRLNERVTHLENNNRYQEFCYFIIVFFTNCFIIDLVITLLN
jgi:hypothetical protein